LSINARKISVALEEMSLPYTVHPIDIGQDRQFADSFLKISPNNKIPAIIDPTGANGEPLAIMESGAILLHLAEKTGKLLPQDAAGRSQALQWVFFQVGSVGPMFGQFGHFYKFAKGKTDTYGEERYGQEVTRLLGVLERQLEGKDYLVGELSIADIAFVLYPFLQIAKPFMKRPLMNSVWMSKEKIKDIQVPILFISGLKDNLIPAEHMKELYRLCKKAPGTKFCAVPEGTHNDTPFHGGQQYYDFVDRFLTDILTGNVSEVEVKSKRTVSTFSESSVLSEDDLPVKFS